MVAQMFGRLYRTMSTDAGKWRALQRGNIWPGWPYITGAVLALLLLGGGLSLIGAKSQAVTGEYLNMAGLRQRLNLEQGGMRNVTLGGDGVGTAGK